MKRNEELFDRYFYKTSPAGDANAESQALTPKTISLEYPMLDSEGGVVKGEKV